MMGLNLKGSMGFPILRAIEISNPPLCGNGRKESGRHERKNTGLQVQKETKGCLEVF